MDNFLRDKNRDTILFVNEVANNQIYFVMNGLELVSRRLKRDLKVLLVTDKRDKMAQKMKVPKGWTQIVVNTSSIIQLEQALLPYQDKLLGAVCRGERNIPYFKNVIPYIPYIRTPSEESLDWMMNKINLRRRLYFYNKKLSPKYTVIGENTPESRKEVKTKVGYPCVVKPAQMAASALVTVCYNEDDLSKALNNALKKLEEVRKKRGFSEQHEVLVEQFMEGTMFSVDVYVNSRGTTYSTPLVHVVTGFMEGKGDFYGFKQMTPSNLKLETRRKAAETAREAAKALGARSITCHVELMKTPQGWKVIEVGPRVGGFRDFLYTKSYGFDHAANDILVRLPLEPKIKYRPIGHSAVMKIYAEEEGIIERMDGVKTVQTLNSFERIDIRYSEGDKAVFARHGGVSIADVYLHNKDRGELLADMRKVEQSLKIKVAKKTSYAKEAPSDYSELLSEDIVISK